MGKKKRKSGGGSGGRISGVAGSRQFLRLALVAIATGMIYFFRDPVAEAVFETCGLGIALIALWLVAIVWILWRRNFQEVWDYWNTWLAALIFTAAGLGIMGLFRPELSVSGIQMADTTLAGSLGKAIVGNSWEWARLFGLILLGTICVAPRESLNTTRQVSASTWQWSKPRLLMFLVEISRLLRKALLWIWAQIRLLFEDLFGGSKQKSNQPKPLKEKKPSLKPAVVVGDEVQLEFPEDPFPIDEQVTVEEIVLPDTNRELPPIGILNEAPKASFVQANDEDRASLIEEALGSYGVEVKVKQINPGPSVTQFGVEPGWVRKYKRVIEKGSDGKPMLDKNGNPKYHMEELSKTRVKVEKITSLANDLALALAVSDIRIEAPVPGKAMVGIEVPNTSTAIVSLRGVIESPVFQKMAAKSKLATALGLGSGGEAVAGDISKMPHLLIAGATGSGKSVCLNCLVACILAQTSPHDVRLVLIDPKRVEMLTFSDIPHLITPIVVDTDKAVETLRRVIMEMDNRYHKFAAVGARNIEAYNRHPKVAEPMSYLVVIVDELADLMMTSADVVEPLLCRLAQLARATGIHLVVATQRPSVDVITGLIKANFPTRIAFAVVSSIDSRTIIDTIGAEKLLGKGDMLYVPPEASKPKRIRGCFVSDDEIGKLVTFWKNWAVKHFPPEADVAAQEFASLSVMPVEADPFLEKARQICDESSRVSASLLQRKLHIGYQRAARLMEQLGEEGLLDDDEEIMSPWEGEL
jgi:DNA segregation ATPase FtsK/SpoIIIE-like protein